MFMNNKLILFLSCICLVLILVGFFFFFKSQKNEVQGFVSGIFGEENYVVMGDKKEKLKLNDPIQIEDTVITGASSSLEITFDVKDEKGRTTLINLYENSELKIQKTFLKSKNGFQVQLLLGYIKVIAKNLLQTDEFKVSTPNATIGVRGTKFYSQYVSESQTTNLHVVEVSEKREVVIAPEKQVETIVPVMTTATVVKMQAPELKPLDTSILPEDPIYIRDLEGLKELLMKGQTENERYRVYLRKTDGSFIFGKEQKERRGSELVYKFDEVMGVEVYFESSQNRVTLNKNTINASALPIYYAFYNPDKIRVKRIMGSQETSLQDAYGNAEGQFFNVFLWESPIEETAPITLEKVVSSGAEDKKSEDKKSKEGDKIHACLQLARHIEARKTEDYSQIIEIENQIKAGWKEMGSKGRDANFRKNLHELTYKKSGLGFDGNCKLHVSAILVNKGASQEEEKTSLEELCGPEAVTPWPECPKTTMEVCGFSEAQCENKLNDFEAFFTSLKSESVLKKCDFDEIERLWNVNITTLKQSDQEAFTKAAGECAHNSNPWIPPPQEQ